MKVCSECGQEYNPHPHKPFVNAMNRYIDLATGKVDGVYNSEVDYMTLPNGKKLVKEGVKVAPGSVPVASTAPVKIPQTAPTGKVEPVVPVVVTPVVAPVVAPVVPVTEPSKVINVNV